MNFSKPIFRHINQTDKEEKSSSYLLRDFKPEFVVDAFRTALRRFIEIVRSIKLTKFTSYIKFEVIRISLVLRERHGVQQLR